MSLHTTTDQLATQRSFVYRIERSGFISVGELVKGLNPAKCESLETYFLSDLGELLPQTM